MERVKFDVSSVGAHLGARKVQQDAGYVGIGAAIDP
jgi:hypothetical protein